MKRLLSILLFGLLSLSLAACGQRLEPSPSQAPDSSAAPSPSVPSSVPVSSKDRTGTIPESFVLIPGRTFQMGSPETEAWRSDDESLHTVTVSDFYMSRYELTQAEYKRVMGSNPSNFSGEKLPVENISWLDAVAYCNALSQAEGRTPVYTIDGGSVTWDRGADGYRLPTEAEWEYACRAGTQTPFNTETSISPEESNYYGHYPYEIEDNYFSQGALTTKPGQYRQTTVEADSFSPTPLACTICTAMWASGSGTSMGAMTPPRRQTPPAQSAVPGGYIAAADGMTLPKTCARLIGRLPRRRTPVLILESGWYAMRHQGPETWRGLLCGQTQITAARC